MITISKIDDVYARVDSDESSILHEMDDFFSFLVPGAAFNPRVRNSAWDGRIHLYNLSKKCILTGLIPKVVHFANERGYEVRVDYNFDFKTISPEVLSEFLESLRLTVGSNPVVPFDFQFDSFLNAIKYNRLLIVNPTGSGKSLVIYCLLRWYLSKMERKILVIVPTSALVHQLYSDFGDYSSQDAEWSPESVCHKIFQGQEKDGAGRVYISTWQSIYKLPKKYFEQFGCVIHDEVHRAQATSLQSIMRKTTNCPFKFGTTGTIQETKTEVLTLIGLFGHVFKPTSTRELADRGIVSPIQVQCVVFDYPEEIKKKLRGATYQEEIDFLLAYPKRNEFIQNLVIRMKSNTLLMFRYVPKHGEILFEQIKAKVEGSGRRVFFVCGKVPGEDRDKIRAIVEKETDAIIVASIATFSTGINIKNLHNIVLASPYKSKIQILQSIGRSLRLHETKDVAILYDLADNLSVGNHRNHTIGHFKERLKYYINEQFEYTVANFSFQ